MRIEKGIKESIQILLYPGDDGKYVILSCRNIRRTYFVDENEGITGEFRKDNFVLIFYFFFFNTTFSTTENFQFCRHTIFTNMLNSFTFFPNKTQ